MNDQPPAAPPVPGTGHYKLTTAALWVGLAVGTVLNVGLQSAGLWLLALPFGLVALASAVGLVARAVVNWKRR
ncbi:hypothetical protein [Glycomyces terrestris]|uniref:Uncharacterized protein n=1 Tax=Glycomyces terrestris TaxID=2493553 RepID=A0A426UVD5_9ACTN|nr:hypothetical protein [Glycomyces terrestris]RRR98159.1 hypothetical protein EIW28_14665 [Glycomyces terrestris]